MIISINNFYPNKTVQVLRVGILLLFLLMSVSAWGANIYVDATLVSDCTSSDYSTANRSCTGADGSAYNTVQEAVTNCSVGDVISIRGGTYTEAIDIPTAKNGTSWATGSFTTLQSYTGEWAILQATGNTARVLYHATAPSYSGSNPTAYWKFERLEITGGRFGMMFTQGPIWVKYCYIHDNVYGGNCDDLAGGLWINQATQCIIEYNWFSYNTGTTPTANCGDITIEADYKDDLDPTNFNPDLAINRNIIRYNLVENSPTGIRHKNQQRFGTSTRTPTDVGSGSYAEWGDKWHHNIVRNFTTMGISPQQDNAQVYNNIVAIDSETPPDNTIGYQLGWEEGISSHQPILFNMVAYNNTAIKVAKSFGTSSGCDKDTPTGTCPQQPHGTPANEECYPYVWFYNNISDLNETDGGDWRYPVVIAAELPTGEYVNMTQVHFKNNLIHDPQNISANIVFIRGRGSYNTLAAAEAAFPQVSGNWQNTTAGLWLSTYIADPSFVVGSATIGNGGIGGNHPYLAGVTIPNYVGATSPGSPTWVADVLSLASTTVLQAGTVTPSDTYGWQCHHAGACWGR